jgi:hypothetical protein
MNKRNVISLTALALTLFTAGCMGDRSEATQQVAPPKPLDEVRRERHPMPPGAEKAMQSTQTKQGTQ